MSADQRDLKPSVGSHHIDRIVVGKYAVDVEAPAHMFLFHELKHLVAKRESIDLLCFLKTLYADEFEELNAVCFSFSQSGIAVSASDADAAAAHGDASLDDIGAVERGEQLEKRAASACGLSEDSDVVGVASEGGDVALYPEGAEALVIASEVSVAFVLRRGCDLGMREESEYVDSVVYGDEDNTSSRDPFAVELHLGRMSFLKTAAVVPNHDRQFLIG